MLAGIPAYFSYRTPHGLITIRSTVQGITDVMFGKVDLTGAYQPSSLTNRAATELLEYFAGKRRTFDIPLAPKGSAFQRIVWDALTHIPYGETSTSSDVARAIGKPNSYRAVGGAVKRNPLAIVVPDHRVIGAQGAPLGADEAARLGTALLELERQHLQAHSSTER